MTKEEALELALEALERSVATCFDQRSHDAVMGRPEHFVNQAITAIKEALAQPEQDDGMCRACENDLCTAKQGCVALDNPPPQRTWVGLTDEEKLFAFQMWRVMDADGFIKAIEAKLKEKNT